MPQAIVAEIGPGPDIIGLEPLLAVSHGVATTRNDLYCRAIVVIPIVVVIVVVGAGERTADRCTRNKAREESTVTMVAASMPSAVTTVPATAGHVPAAATDEARRAATATEVSTATATTTNEARSTATATHVAAAADMAASAHVCAASASANEVRRLREARGCYRQRRRKRDHRRCQYRFVILHIRNSISS